MILSDQGYKKDLLWIFHVNTMLVTLQCTWRNKEIENFWLDNPGCANLEWDNSLRHPLGALLA